MITDRSTRETARLVVRVFLFSILPKGIRKKSEARCIYFFISTCNAAIKWMDGGGGRMMSIFYVAYLFST